MDRFQWDLGRELPGDRDLLQTGRALEGRSIALCLSGGIAAYRAPDLVRALRREGAEVLVYATPQALRFVSREALEWCSLRPVVEQLDGKAQHVEDSRAVDLYLLAPATYSTLNKVAWGFADNAVTTTLASALGRLEAGHSEVMVVPTMHGSMVNSILTESLQRLEDR
ncbi:MAG: flavoprotein, partial [Myxococcota bacterium]|nr:flavoprotein [Myxococcota bacterium]